MGCAGFAMIDGDEMGIKVEEMSDPQDHPLKVAEPNVAAWLNLSHELRTPVNAIAGHVELLLSGSAGPLSADARSSLGEIQRAAATLTTAIGEVVQLAEDLTVHSSTTSVSRQKVAGPKAG